MFNQYLPPPEAYAPVQPPAGGKPGVGKGLGELLKLLRVEKWDSGDLLLALIVLLLWREDRDTDLLLAVGGALLLGDD